ncbi:MAG: hypothetical protein JWO16_114 [Sphingomonas bacterium]|nr:hypothetical protein [Sphingomonas bacterium]
MSNVERNKDIVTRFMTAQSEGRMADAWAMLDRSGSWWSLTERRAISIGDYIQLWEKLITAQFPNGLPITITDMTAEHNRVAVRAESRGTMDNGVPYNNLYFFQYEIGDDGRIVKAYEHGDTHHVRTTLRARHAETLVATEEMSQ